MENALRRKDSALSDLREEASLAAKRQEKAAAEVRVQKEEIRGLECTIATLEMVNKKYKAYFKQ